MEPQIEQKTVDSPQTGSNNMVIMIAGVALLALVGGGILFLSSNNKNSLSTPSPKAQIMEKKESPNSSSVASSSASPSAMMEKDKNAKVFNLDAGGFYYKPNEIKVKKGDTVKIVMTSKDMMHDFVIDELSVKIPITKSGETNEVTFVAEKAGTFEFYCSVGSHRKQGQVGKIIIE